MTLSNLKTEKSLVENAEEEEKHTERCVFNIWEMTLVVAKCM